MNQIYNSITEIIGNTPIIKLQRMVQNVPATILVKLESLNPGASVKDRIALSMIEAAEQEGLLKPDSHIVEPTSGNTGIGLALVCASRGYTLTLTMPENMSIERRKILQAYGANVVLTPASQGMRGAIEKAQELGKTDTRVFIPQQFTNPANPEVHRQKTAREILDVVGQHLDAFVAGVGTGGTLTGIGEVLRKEIKHPIKIIAVEPAESATLSGGKVGNHKIQGLGAGFVPDILNTKIYDEVIAVDFENAIQTARSLAKLEGIFAGISSGAALWAALQISKKMKRGQVILVLLPDTGERYLSTELWQFPES